MATLDKNHPVFVAADYTPEMLKTLSSRAKIKIMFKAVESYMCDRDEAKNYLRQPVVEKLVRDKSGAWQGPNLIEHLVRDDNAFHEMAQGMARNLAGVFC